MNSQCVGLPEGTNLPVQEQSTEAAHQLYQARNPVTLLDCALVRTQPKKTYPDSNEIDIAEIEHLFKLETYTIPRRVNTYGVHAHSCGTLAVEEKTNVSVRN